MLLFKSKLSAEAVRVLGVKSDEGRPEVRLIAPMCTPVSESLTKLAPTRSNL